MFIHVDLDLGRSEKEKKQQQNKQPPGRRVRQVGATHQLGGVYQNTDGPMLRPAAAAGGTSSPKFWLGPQNLAVLLTHCGQLILRKKTVKLMPPDFKTKMHHIRFPLGFCPRPRCESLQRSPRPSSWI